MDRTWTEEGTAFYNHKFELCRGIWEATGDSLSYGGCFSIVQTEEHPDELVMDAVDEYSQALTRDDVERLVRNLQTWLDHGKETFAHELDEDEGAEYKDCDEDSLKTAMADSVRKAAEECGAEKVVLVSNRRFNGEPYWEFYIVWGRETTYMDMVHLLDGCGWIQRHARFYSSEEMGEIDRYGDGIVETIYEKQGSEIDSPSSV